MSHENSDEADVDKDLIELDKAFRNAKANVRSMRLAFGKEDSDGVHQEQAATGRGDTSGEPCIESEYVYQGI